ncbi:hypothetical protein like AT3G10120 [Hibiscus trionum]|uniref:Uncharacterized protein n=1 Tax=Hibiscus trionum TaxID=183268 RepID=A0A9W7MNY4_HIBTR|nr:hypothetical protein like AT3G10120 [Hibiscus trionum]
MGNCWALVKPSECSRPRDARDKPNRNVVRVVKMDGKMLEFKAPLLVKDVLVKYSGSGIGFSKTVSQHLPLNYELKTGNVYYILPASDSSSVTDTQQAGAGGVKRIKVVITKQELQQLLTKQISVAEVLAGLQKRNGSSVVSPRNWKPKLESISEENE